MEEIETINKGDFEIKIFQDEFAENPRSWDNMFKMVCFHNHYDLGDKTNLNQNSFNGWDELKEYLIKEEEAVFILPLYLYDHSGITISTTPFGYRWDSGQIGFIYTTNKLLEEMGHPLNVSKDKLKKWAIAETKIYDNYLTGEVFSFQLEYKDGHLIDSVSGFYGFDHDKSGLLDYAEDSIKSFDIAEYEANKKKERIEFLKNTMKKHKEELNALLEV
jgi:hypothetical protein